MAFWTPNTVTGPSEGNFIHEGEGFTAHLFIEDNWMDDNRSGVIIVWDGPHTYSTTSTQDWPRVAAKVPQTEWPSVIYTGQNTWGQAQPDVEAAIDQALINDLADLLKQDLEELAETDPDDEDNIASVRDQITYDLAKISDTQFGAERAERVRAAAYTQAKQQTAH